MIILQIKQKTNFSKISLCTFDKCSHPKTLSTGIVIWTYVASLLTEIFWFCCPTLKFPTFLPKLKPEDSVLCCPRLKFCTILPKLKSQMKLPKDMQHLQQLELEVRKLLAMEKDNDVVTTVRSVSEWLCT